jgi:hypothetical protein
MFVHRFEKRRISYPKSNPHGAQGTSMEIIEF